MRYMPIFDMKCLECGKVSEGFIRGSDRAPRCPDCGSYNSEKLISSPYMIKSNNREPSTTCCGRDERCDKPPCSTGGMCRRQ